MFDVKVTRYDLTKIGVNTIPFLDTDSNIDNMCLSAQFFFRVFIA